MQEFYDRWSHQDPILHLSPSLPDGFLFRSIKSSWFEMAEQATEAAAKAAAKATEATAKDAAKATEDTDNAAVEVGKRILVRETISQANTIVQYGSEKTKNGWTRHIVAFRQDEESPFPLPAVLAVPVTTFTNSFTTSFTTASSATAAASATASSSAAASSAASSYMS